MKIASREYKLMLTKAAAAGWALLWDQINQSLPVEGKLELSNSRHVIFLDTLGEQLRLNNYVLRKRTYKDASVDYTLKRRSPDLFIACGEKIRSKEKLKLKFEEDIAFPFRSKFSYSGTVSLKIDVHPAYLFKNLEKFISLDEHFGSSIFAVNEVRIEEFVYKGAYFELGKHKLDIALIVWKRNSEIVLGEISFRYANKKGEYPMKLAVQAADIFQELFSMDGIDPKGTTKTQFIYNEPSWMERTLMRSEQKVKILSDTKDKLYID